MVMMGSFLLVSSLFGQNRPGLRGEGMRESGDLWERLSLTEDQESRMEKLRSDIQKAMVKQRADIRLARIELGDLMEADRPDKDLILKKMKEIADLELRAKTSMVDHQFEVRNLLTADQLKIWTEHHRGGMRFCCEGEGPRRLHRWRDEEGMGMRGCPRREFRPDDSF
jgi:Spy/CpxP family protein refolding chaperone